MKLYTIAEAAELCGVSVATLKRRIREAEIVLPRLGRDVSLTEKDLAAVIEASRWRDRPVKQPKPKLSPEQFRLRQGDRIREGKRRTRDLFAQIRDQLGKEK